MSRLTIELVEIKLDRKWTIEFLYMFGHGEWHVSSMGGQYMRYPSLLEILNSSLVPESISAQLLQLLDDTGFTFPIPRIKNVKNSN